MGISYTKSITFNYSNPDGNYLKRYNNYSRKNEQFSKKQYARILRFSKSRKALYPCNGWMSGLLQSHKFTKNFYTTIQHCSRIRINTKMQHINTRPILNFPDTISQLCVTSPISSPTPISSTSQLPQQHSYPELPKTKGGSLAPNAMAFFI